MPVLGPAALLLSFDIDADAIDEHDRWHTHEHLPERLGIPGFLRGTRWVATAGAPRYLVIYEVQSLLTLTSEAYRARLDAPSPWTQRVMPHYRGMVRGLCTVLGSHGHGLGGSAALVRYAAPEDEAQAWALQRWLLDDVLPPLPARAGLGSAHLLQGAQVAAMTNEQRIRGADRGVDAAIVITGYDGEAVAARARALCAPDGLPGRGAQEVTWATYRTAYTLTSAEMGLSPPGPGATPTGAAAVGADPSAAPE